ncbi:MAG: hypothetical protein ABJA83_04675 [Burkholderiaceae bacterium]
MTARGSGESTIFFPTTYRWVSDVSDSDKVPDEAVWHRKFGAACNNRAWNLSVQPHRSPAEDLKMLDASHASAWHWGHIGTELHRIRAMMLLADVYALVGRGSSALAYAREMRDYFLRTGAPDWEVALAHAIYAHAAAIAGDREQHIASYRLAVDAVAGIADEEDRRIVVQTFGHVPSP